MLRLVIKVIYLVFVFLSFYYNLFYYFLEIEKKDEATVKQEIPFSTEFQNIKCLKCKTWGHLNTDKACPLYGKSKLDTDPDYKPMDLQVLAPAGYKGI